jgi:DNA polymerase-3 subunit epsilon
VSGELSLFDDEQPAEPVRQVSGPAPIADWQVDVLRKTLTAHGLTTMLERRQAIEAAAGRPVQSLRALTHAEALLVLSRLGPPPESQTGSSSAWDNRNEDTWIDRL